MQKIISRPAVAGAVLLVILLLAGCIEGTGRGPRVPAKTSSAPSGGSTTPDASQRELSSLCRRYYTYIIANGLSYGFPNGPEADTFTHRGSNWTVTGDMVVTDPKLLERKSWNSTFSCSADKTSTGWINLRLT